MCIYQRVRIYYITSFSFITTVLKHRPYYPHKHKTHLKLSHSQPLYPQSSQTKGPPLYVACNGFVSNFPAKNSWRRALTKVNGRHCTKPRRFISRTRVMGKKYCMSGSHPFHRRARRCSGESGIPVALRKDRTGSGRWRRSWEPVEGGCRRS